MHESGRPVIDFHYEFYLLTKKVVNVPDRRAKKPIPGEKFMDTAGRIGSKRTWTIPYFSGYVVSVVSDRDASLKLFDVFDQIALLLVIGRPER